MASNNETGHDRNVANFETLISFVKGFGEKYKPVKAVNKIDFLERLLAEAREAKGALSIVKTGFDAATNQRFRTFVPLRRLSTRLMASFRQVAEDEEVEDLKAHHRKIHGTRAIKKPKPKPGEQPGADEALPEQTERSISVAQLSFDNLLEHFGKMITRLKSHTAYKPNEVELRVESLDTLLDEMNTVNSAVKLAASPYKTALIARNTVLYKPKTGLKAVAESVKDYVMSVYGHGTPEHRLVSGLAFSGLKDA